MDWVKIYTAAWFSFQVYWLSKKFFMAVKEKNDVPLFAVCVTTAIIVITPMVARVFEVI